MSPPRDPHPSATAQKVPDELGGSHLDKVVAQLFQLSRRLARVAIGEGRVTVDGKPARILQKPVRAGARIECRVERAEEAQRTPEISLPMPELLYLDRELVIVNKPAGLLSETDRLGSPSLESLVPALLAERGERDQRVWLVHRLDAGTSGVIVLARTPAATRAMGDVFREGRVAKTYWALVRGRITEAKLIDAPIDRDKGTKQRVAATGKPARTRIAPLGYAPAADATWVEVKPLTGRTHQIRVHLAHLGHPLLGDRLYGGPGYVATVPPRAVHRFMLHARRVELPQPKTRARLDIEAPPAADFAELAQILGLVLLPA